MRWTPKRKAELLDRMKREPEKTVELMQEHNVSAEELILWRTAAQRGGIGALKVAAIPDNRSIKA